VLFQEGNTQIGIVKKPRVFLSIISREIQKGLILTDYFAQAVSLLK